MNIIKKLSLCAIILCISSCGVGSLLTNAPVTQKNKVLSVNINPEDVDLNPEKPSVFDLFKDTDDETVLKVNRYIWKASFEVLSFLPIEGADPFSGVITTGWGMPPGSKTLYRATVFIQDPSLDARSLKVNLFRKTGTVDVKTIRVIENAILSRARQLRINDDKL